MAFFIFRHKHARLNNVYFAVYYNLLAFSLLPWLFITETLFFTNYTIHRNPITWHTSYLNLRIRFFLPYLISPYGIFSPFDINFLTYMEICFLKKNHINVSRQALIKFHCPEYLVTNGFRHKLEHENLTHHKQRFSHSCFFYSYFWC